MQDVNHQHILPIRGVRNSRVCVSIVIVQISIVIVQISIVIVQRRQSAKSQTVNGLTTNQVILHLLESKNILTPELKVRGTGVFRFHLKLNTRFDIKPENQEKIWQEVWHIPRVSREGVK